MMLLKYRFMSLVFLICLGACHEKTSDNSAPTENKNVILSPYKGIGDLTLGSLLLVDDEKSRLMEKQGVVAITNADNRIELIITRNPDVKVESLGIGVGDSLERLQKATDNSFELLPQDGKLKYRRAHYKGVTYEIGDDDTIISMMIAQRIE